MKKYLLVLGLSIAVVGCSRSEGFEIQPGSDVTVEKKDGVSVAGRLVEVKPEHVVIAGTDGVQRTVPRSNIVSLRAVPVSQSPVQPNDGRPVATSGEGQAATPPAVTEEAAGLDSSSAERRGPSAADPAEEDRRTAAEFREITIPAGTVLPLTLRTSLSSDKSNVEDPVRATLRSAVKVRGAQALPAGTLVTGHVTNAKESARVKGRAQLAFRFTRLDPPGDEGAVRIATGTVSRIAPGTKKRDAATIGGGAVGGAIVGGILGGGDGAAKGAAIGGAGGTGVVLATRGKEVRLPAGTAVSVRLTQPLTVRVPLR